MMDWASVSGFVADHAAPLAVGASALAVAGLHVPFRGRSLRDAWRGPHPVPTAGVRVTAAGRNLLPASALVDAVTECPVPVDVVSVLRTTARPGGEVAHRYRSFAGRLGVADSDWISVLVGGPAEHDRARLEFFVHRLGLLGLRARPLSGTEFTAATANPSGTDAERLLARAPGRGHVRRPHLWFTPAHDVEVPPAPAQLVGTSRDGGPLVMSLPSIDRLDVVADADRLPELLAPTLLTGARVGIRTHRPRQFGVLLDHGAVLVPAAGDPTLDVLVLDGGARVARRPGTPTVVLHDADGTATTALPAEHAPPSLTIGDHAWHLTIGDEKTPVRPVPMFSAMG